MTIFAPVVSPEEFIVAALWLRQKIPAGFWSLLHEHVSEYCCLERNRDMQYLIKRLWLMSIQVDDEEWTMKAHGIKLLSHFGAIPAHRGITDYEVYDSSGQAYHDATNEVYTEVLHRLWPGCLPGLSNVETIGDVMEAFLGICWFMGHPENERRHLFREQLEVVKRVNKVVSFIHGNWGSRDRYLGLIPC